MSPPGRIFLKIRDLPRRGGGFLAPADAGPFEDARRDADRLALVENVQPVAIERDRVGTPGMAHRAARLENRKFLKQIALAADTGALAILHDAIARLGVEVMARPAGIGGAFAAQIAADVAAVFAQKRLRLVFGMALQEDQQRIVLAREHAD